MASFSSLLDSAIKASVSAKPLKAVYDADDKGRKLTMLLPVPKGLVDWSDKSIKSAVEALDTDEDGDPIMIKANVRKEMPGVEYSRPYVWLPETAASMIGVSPSGAGEDKGKGKGKGKGKAPATDKAPADNPAA